MRYYSTAGEEYWESEIQGVFMLVSGRYQAVICPDFKTVLVKHPVDTVQIADIN